MRLERSLSRLLGVSFLLTLGFIFYGCEIPHENGEVVYIDDLNLTKTEVKSLKRDREYKFIILSSQLNREPNLYENGESLYITPIEQIDNYLYGITVKPVSSGKTSINIDGDTYYFRVE